MAARLYAPTGTVVRVPDTTARQQIRVSGIVQGVGFRPFVYNVAHALGLQGYVQNTSEGVLIDIEGSAAALTDFLRQLTDSPPPLAHIDDINVRELVPVAYTNFVIRDSEDQAGAFVLVSPDVSTCHDCWRECTDPHNRRYSYPFTNCTNCGPRYTIIRDIPYDRPLTTMAKFQMCPGCQAEYHDAADRRFHAQPNACPECGPTLALVRRGSLPLNERLLFTSGQSNHAILREVRRLLSEGNILAIKGLGGFHLACDAENDHAVRRLRAGKRRSDKPFAVMMRDLAAVERVCVVSDADRQLLLDIRRPIVLLPRRADTQISSAIAPSNHTLGVMLPYTPLHHLLFGDSPETAPTFTALVMTSGNRGEEPIVTTNEEACERLEPLADWLLVHNRDIYTRVDDSVVRPFQGTGHVVRRARGYAPYPINLDLQLTEVLACGPELKNTFCLTKGRYAFLSQHIGDLANYETLRFFQETLERMQKLFRITPQVVAHDLHPLYLSTRFALERDDMEKIGVQHHHAHIASCMAEHRLRGKVIGVAFDGTGYGTDGQIWGGEFLVADFVRCERRAHFRYVALPGGDTAIREPWRVAVSYLWDTFGTHIASLDLPLHQQVSPQRWALVQSMIARGINTVHTSSCGRLFDAVAALANVRHEVTFEGQAAIELEMAVIEGIEERYPFVLELSEPWQIDLRPMIEQLVRDLQHGASPGLIAAKFHNTVAAVIVDVCHRVRQEDGLKRVCLSGGTFQNMVLLTRVVRALQRDSFEVFLHAQVPPNDGGIALGQAVIANAIVRQGP
ncbi:MAG: carbamoyltransferase HypF [Candidatus Binatia bacterium]